MSNDTYRFSVIIPVYNAVQLLPKCIESLINQTYKNFEIVALDDGSKDNSYDVLKKYKDENPQMHFNISRHQNCGAGETRNIGLSVATGEYIMFLDSDDYIDDDYLEKANYLIDREDADVVFVDIVREDTDGHFIRYERMSQYERLSRERMIKWQLTGKMPWGGWRKLIKASIIHENNLKYASIKVGEESIFSFHVLMKAQKVAFQKESYYHYVESATSLTYHDNTNNPQSVFDFISDYINGSSYKKEYETTINALGVTTVAILINILAQERSFINAIKESRKYLKKYNKSITGKVNKDALESRILYCYPFMRAGVTFPIILGSYIQRIIKTIKSKKR